MLIRVLSMRTGVSRRRPTAGSRRDRGSGCRVHSEDPETLVAQEQRERRRDPGHRGAELVQAHRPELDRSHDRRIGQRPLVVEHAATDRAERVGAREHADSRPESGATDEDGRPAEQVERE